MSIDHKHKSDDMFYCEVATSMIARHKKPRHDLIVVLHSKSCDAAEKVVVRLLKTRDHRGGDSTVNRCFAQNRYQLENPYLSQN